MLSAAMDVDDATISSDALRDKYRALVEAALEARSVFVAPATVAVRLATLDSWYLVPSARFDWSACALRSIVFRSSV